MTETKILIPNNLVQRCVTAAKAEEVEQWNRWRDTPMQMMIDLKKELEAVPEGERAAEVEIIQTVNDGKEITLSAYHYMFTENGWEEMGKYFCGKYPFSVTSINAFDALMIQEGFDVQFDETNEFRYYVIPPQEEG